MEECEGRRGGEKERERASARERERVRGLTSAHALGRDSRRDSPRESALAPPFICFFLHLGLPYANWA